VTQIFDNSTIFNLLEWPALFEHLLSECLTPYGLKDWRKNPFLESSDAIQNHILEVDGLKTLLQRYGDVTLDSEWPDIAPAINRLLKEGLLSLTELQGVLRTLREGGIMVRHFAKMLKSESQLSFLESLLQEEQIPENALTYLLKHFHPSGELRDDATPRLAELKRTLQHRINAQQRQIQALLQHPDIVPALRSTTITERDGRLVIPVKSEFKNRIPGVIHGGSSSGSTVFIEPEALVKLNNDLSELQSDIQEEISRIVMMLSRGLHPEAELLKDFVDCLAQLDRRLAAARLSRKLDAYPCELETQTQLIHIRNARHPLLLLMNARHTWERIISNDLDLGNETQPERLLLITGPNTGGKTVLLKMLGLFALMMRAGLHLPVAEGSRMSCFNPVVAILGDQQDLTQNLSTFSAHVQQLQNLVADETNLNRGLILIDEIAAGTDPIEGAALAKAVLDEIYQKGALAIITTHLGELKVEAHRHPGYLNASMMFDAETLSPTYRLLVGVPGASNALIIAERLGLKPSVIQKARTMLSAPTRESSELLQELETRNQQAQQELDSARSYRLEAQASWERNEADRQRFEHERRQSLKQLQSSVKGRINELEERLKRWRKDVALAESGAAGDHFDSDQLSAQLRSAGRRADNIFNKTRESFQEKPTYQWDDLKLGMKVTSRQLELSGEIVDLLTQSKEVIIQAGLVRLTLPLDDIEGQRRQAGAPNLKAKASAKPQQARRLDRPMRYKEGESHQASSNSNASPTPAEAIDPTTVCDVRGKRALEAIEEVEKFLDDAIMSGESAVAIVHGLGTGVLKKEIRQYLAKSSYVRRYYPAQAVRGGDGKTIIELTSY
jgi:DNA mismatch repair protein MutS2